MGFDVNEYWINRGRSYVHEKFPQQFHRNQEKFLLEILRASKIPLATILELGCGFGRITRLLGQLFPQTKITALDLSPEQLANARRYCAGQSNITFGQYDLYSDRPFPADTFDAVVAIEVFLHHPQAAVLELFKKLSIVGHHLINIDWSEEWPWKTDEHVWVHNYKALYEEAGLQCATFTLPDKVDGKQQKLFIAAATLSPAIQDLEQQMYESLISGSNMESASSNLEPMPDAVAWPQHMALAAEDIRQTVPAGSTFILVNDDQWGNESRVFPDYRILPFMEHNGGYWGPPDNDSLAVMELDRLQRMGASYIVFAWNSFWWLDHYRSLDQRLRQKSALLLENQRVKIFRLPSCA